MDRGTEKGTKIYNWTHLRPRWQTITWWTNHTLNVDIQSENECTRWSGQVEGKTMFKRRLTEHWRSRHILTNCFHEITQNVYSLMSWMLQTSQELDFVSAIIQSKVRRFFVYLDDTVEEICHVFSKYVGRPLLLERAIYGFATNGANIGMKT